MKKNDAVRHFNDFYDTTYNDAMTFIAGKAGDTDIAPDVLTDTYTAVFALMQKQKEYDGAAVADEFYRALNNAIERHKRRPTEASHGTHASDGVMLSELCGRVLDLNEQAAHDDMLIKKAHSYVLQCDSTDRKAFILYFYEGYTAQKIAELLGITEGEVFGHLESTVSGIQHNFLAKYIIK